MIRLIRGIIRFMKEFRKMIKMEREFWRGDRSDPRHRVGNCYGRINE
jgi:hypothetical protein